ncbi:MAG: WGR domain-containing protein [Alphaproteobacteria bacterium]|nr:WGR domain-containing protein [Candidatus Jidaibacter sp.]
MYTFFWRKLHKYYYIELRDDLFGGVSLIQKWGSNKRQGSRSISKHFSSIQESTPCLRQALKRRAKRGYMLQAAKHFGCRLQSKEC